MRTKTNKNILSIIAALMTAINKATGSYAGSLDTRFLDAHDEDRSRRVSRLAEPDSEGKMVDPEGNLVEIGETLKCTAKRLKESGLSMNEIVEKFGLSYDYPLADNESLTIGKLVLQTIHTPGHTIGSLIVLLEGGELISGDTFFGVEGKQHFPPFAEDLPALLRSWEMVHGLEAKKIYPAHGRSFAFEKFLDEYPLAAEKYAGRD